MERVDDNGDGTFDRAERYVYDDSGKYDPGTGVPLDDIVLVFDDSGSLTNRYLHGPAIDQILADEQLTNGIIDEVLWSLSDHLGTIRDWAAYDAALAETTVANHLTFDSFGNITSQTDPSASLLYAFTGREWDPDAELYYYRAQARIRTVVDGWLILRILEILKKEPNDAEGIPLVRPRPRPIRLG